MRSSTYAALTLNLPSYNDQRPLNELKTQLDEVYFADKHRPHQWFLTANGRTAMYVFLKSLNLPAGSEVIVQSFTCVSAINPVLWAGLTPVYADIDAHTLSAAPQSLQSLITDRTKLIILQHTFGAPGALQAVQSLAKKHNLLILEDCAHALGSKFDSQPLGTFGDAAIISFGIEKSLSTKLGGALLINNPDLVRSVEATYRAIPPLPRTQTFLWLIYPGIRQILRKLPPKLTNPAKTTLEFIGVLKRAVAKPEYTGATPRHILSKLPGVYAKIILDALTTLPQASAHRQLISSIYYDKLQENRLVKPVLQGHSLQTPLIKFPLICQSPELRNHIVAALTAKDIYISTWYDPPIYPAKVDYKAIGYTPADCLAAESVAPRILCLPTGLNISRAHATIIINEVNACAAQYNRGAESVSQPS